ncbi:MAG: RraA family protein [Rhodovarius sp.]|nr:RraA family protein [Rhodovarius sp.]
MPIGFAVHPRRRAVTAEIVAAFRGIPVANVSDCMGRLPAAGAHIRPLHRFGEGGAGLLAGPALTVKTRPGDNLMIHKAIQLAAPGDVIVVDGGGELSHALIGELMATSMLQAGVAGVVIHGAVRDLGWIAARHFPVYAAGVTHRGPYKDGPGEINCPIAIGGMVIEPGDLILGDEDGVLAVPFAQCEEVLAAARAKQAAEERQMAAILAGRHDASWVDEALRARGCTGL